MEPVEETREQLGQVHQVLTTSLEKLLARGSALSALDEQSHRLSLTALEFQRHSLILRRSMWWRQGKLLLALSLLVILLLILVYLYLAGGKTSGP